MSGWPLVPVVGELGYCSWKEARRRLFSSAARRAASVVLPLPGMPAMEMRSRWEASRRLYSAGGYVRWCGMGPWGGSFPTPGVLC